MDKKKGLILISVFLCVIWFLLDLCLIEMEQKEGHSITQVKRGFQDEIQELKNGKYENLTAADFQTSIEEVEEVYHLQILFPEDYVEVSFLEDVHLRIKEDAALAEKNAFKRLWNSKRKHQRILEKFEVVNEAIDSFFQTEVEKTGLMVNYGIDESYIEVGYPEFRDLLTEGLTMNHNFFSVFGNNTADSGYMIQIASTLNGAWFSRGELGDIMPSFNDCKVTYTYLSGKRQGEDRILHLLDGDIWLSEMEQHVLAYLNTDAFPLPKTKGIAYEIGEARVLKNKKQEDYEGICFIIRRVYKGVPFACGSWGTWYVCDTSEISYARSNVPDTMRGFFGVNGEVMEAQKISDIVSVGEALEILSDYFGNKNGKYEVRGVELVYKHVPVPQEDETTISDILNPKWQFIVCPDGSNKEITYFIDAQTGEIG